jgi:hypothetical protein
MRRLGAICLAFGLAAPALAADPPAAEESTSVPWYRWLFLGERSKPADKPVAKESTPPRPASAASSREAIAKKMADEQKIYLDRLSAIDKIKRIALEQGDEETLKKAEDLEAQAAELYQLRTAKLPSVDELKSDRAALERGRDTRPATAQRRPGGNDR